MSLHHVVAGGPESSGHTTTIVAGKVEPPRPCMALVPGAGLQYFDEIQPLLRYRLRIVALIMGISSALFLARSIFAPVEELPVGELPLHAAMVAILAVSNLLLWFGDHGLACLRRLELAIFGAMTLFFAYLQFTDLHLAALVEGVAVDHQERIINLGILVIAMRWLVLIVLYGTFIPNTWQRCLAVVGTISAVPLVTTFWKCFFCPILGQHWPVALFDMAVILAVADATASFGSYKISELQQKAFEAKKLGQYRLHRKIGSGGMGDVYLGEHLLLRRACAIKTIRPEQAGDPLTLSRFEREVQAMANLTHWNSVEIYDYGHAADGTFYYVMEYLPGMTLQELIDKHGPLPAGRAIFLLRQICGALHEAHGIGLIHRDIKPSNVLLCRRGGLADVAKLLDFGLVQDLGASLPSERLTLHGAVLGSPPFISPEQARGNQPVDERTDIYGLGGLAYFLMTGHPPFERDSALEMMAAHLHEPVTSPQQLRPEVPADLQDVILRCLAKSPDDRFADIAAVDHMLALCEAAGDWDAEHAEVWWTEREAAPSEAQPEAAAAMAG